MDEDPNRFIALEYLRKRGRLIWLDDLSEDEIAAQMVRTDQNTVCDICGLKHREHKLIENVIDWTNIRPAPFLYYICDGTIAKL